MLRQSNIQLSIYLPHSREFDALNQNITFVVVNYLFICLVCQYTGAKIGSNTLNQPNIKLILMILF